MIGRATAIGLIASFAAARVAPALDPAKAFHQFKLDAWQSEEGLSQGSVLAVLQTSDGYLWLGGYEGLERFDGVRFTSFNHSNTPALRDNNIFALAESSDGSLWIGTDGGGLLRYQAGRFTAYSIDDGLIDDRVYCLYPSRAGGIWIGTKGGLSRFEEGRFTNYGTREGLPDTQVTALEEDRDGRLWIGTNDGLARLENGTLSTYTREDGLAGNVIAALAIDQTGDLWIGGYGAVLTRYRDGAFAEMPLANDATANAISFLEDRDGTLWIGTHGGGLLRMREGQVSAHGPADGLTSDLVWAMIEDREGSLWIGTEGGGLVRLKDTPLVPITERDGLPYQRILVVYEDPEDSLWIGSDGGGLLKLENGDFTGISMRDGLASDVITSIHRRRNGDLWIGTNSGVNQLRQGRVRAELASEIGVVSVKAIFEDRHESLWIGLDGGGLIRIEGREVTTYSESDGLPGDTVRTLAEDRDGALWVGADGGLARLEDGVITAQVETPGLTDAFVRAIHQDAEGSLWIGTRGNGLSRLRNGEVDTFTTRDGLFNDVIYQVLEDDRQNLWMSCSKGIFRVAKGALDRLARGEVSSVASVNYGIADGMQTLESGGGNQPAGWKTRDGKLWFPTNKGLIVVDPERIQTDPPVPPVYIEQVLAQGAGVNRRDSAANTPVTLPPGVKELEFHYTALSYSDPAKVRFKYRLEGYDTAWVEAGPRRSAYYTNLSPGSYQFHVTASHGDGAWNTTGAAIDLRLRPAFYQTWIFYLVCGLATTLAAWGLYQLRIRGLMRRNEQLRRLHGELKAKHAEVEAKNAEVEAKNAEIQRFTYAVSHDLKSPLVTVLGFLGFLERDLEQGKRERVAADVERIRNAATKMQQLLDELLELSRIGSMDNPREDVDLGERAFEALELVSGRIAERGVEVHISSALPVVIGDRARLLQLFQNLIDNAVKFMGSQDEPRIEIGTLSGQRTEQEAVCYVRDNGQGIAPAYQEQVFGLFNQLDAKAEGAGMGLALVRRIVEVHDGRIWLESDGEGQGCTFFFTLPVRDASPTGS